MIAERALDNFGKFVHQFRPETKTLKQKLKRIFIKFIDIDVFII